MKLLLWFPVLVVGLLTIGGPAPAQAAPHQDSSAKEGSVDHLKIDPDDTEGSYDYTYDDDNKYSMLWKWLLGILESQEYFKIPEDGISEDSSALDTGSTSLYNYYE